MTMDQLLAPPPSPLQRITDWRWDKRNVQLWIKRDDLLAPRLNDPLCGNKWRKLQHNLARAKQQGYSKLLTFGGAFSNHLAAVASAGHHFGFQTIGLVRGDTVENPTLELAQRNGMELHFISRTAYRRKQEADFLQDIKNRFGPVFILPEGGTNTAAFHGCAELAREILQQAPSPPTHLAVACGTGGTAAGLTQGLAGQSQLLGVAVLKGGFMSKEIRTHLDSLSLSADNWSVADDYHHGGYARHSRALDAFIQSFYEEQRILLDPIYTGKLFYALYDLLKQGYFPEDSRVVGIHTGGLQAFASARP